MAATVPNPLAATQYASQYNPQRRVQAKTRPQYDPTFDSGAPFLAAYFSAFLGLRSNLNNQLLQQRLAQLDPSSIAKEIDRLQASVARLRAQQANYERVKSEGDARALAEVIRGEYGIAGDRITASKDISVAQMTTAAGIRLQYLEHWNKMMEASDLDPDELRDERALNSESFKAWFKKSDPNVEKLSDDPELRDALSRAVSSYKRLGGVIGNTDDPASIRRALEVYRQIQMAGGSDENSEMYASADRVAERFWANVMGPATTVESALEAISYPTDRVEEAVKQSMRGAGGAFYSDPMDSLKEYGLYDKVMELAGGETRETRSTVAGAWSGLADADPELAKLHARVVSGETLSDAERVAYRDQVNDVVQRAKTEGGDAEELANLLWATQPGVAQRALSGEEGMDQVASTIDKMEKRLAGLYDRYDAAMAEGPERYTQAFDQYAQGRNWLLANPYVRETGPSEDVELLRGMPSDLKSETSLGFDDARPFGGERDPLDPLETPYGNVTREARGRAAIEDVRRHEPQGTQNIYTGSMSHEGVVRSLDGAIRLYESGQDDAAWRVLQVIANDPSTGEAGRALRDAIKGAHSHQSRQTFMSDIGKIADAVDSARQVQEREIQTGLRQSQRPEPYAIDKALRGLEDFAGFGAINELQDRDPEVFNDLVGIVGSLEDRRETLNAELAQAESGVFDIEDESLDLLWGYRLTEGKMNAALKEGKAAQARGDESIAQSIFDHAKALERELQAMDTPAYREARDRYDDTFAKVELIDAQISEVDDLIVEHKSDLQTAAAYGRFDWWSMEPEERAEVLRARKDKAKALHDAWRAEGNPEKAEEAWRVHQAYDREIGKIEIRDAGELDHWNKTGKGVEAAQTHEGARPIVDGE